jgi:hypothetical protein
MSSGSLTQSLSQCSSPMAVSATWPSCVPATTSVPDVDDSFPVVDVSISGVDDCRSGEEVVEVGL